MIPEEKLGTTLSLDSHGFFSTLRPNIADGLFFVAHALVLMTSRLTYASTSADIRLYAEKIRTLDECFLVLAFSSLG